MKALLPPTKSFPWPTLKLADPNKPKAYQEALTAQGVKYGLGAKVPHLGCDLSEIHELDCSGFVRDALFRTLGRPEDFSFPDGSVQQHEWVIEKGFKESTVEDAKNHDGHLRIAFLTPEDGISVGHVALLTGGHTYESHGGKGPDSRVWGSHGWMSKCSVYVLALS